MSEIEARLAELGVTLPRPAAPAANYVPISQQGRTLFISGQLSAGPNGMITGRLGDTVSLEEGQAAAQAAAVNILAHIRHTAGFPLESVAAFHKLTVLVCAAPDFTEHHLVANGASNLIGDVFGEAGKHARAAFGVTSLPLGAAVEIDAIVELAD
ncbi:RidA family protein [Cucumibacter marinus]|uniref:RidA family protein n=1 Tax=Cucumibacter marinus TaxID=1121252 RepID=UPI00040061A2|nr:RidA family protein [Cucumibacter marinus]